MTATPNHESAQAVLDRLGIAVPAGDIPFLQRTFLWQREVLRALSARLAAEAEPAHVFKAPNP